MFQLTEPPSQGWGGGLFILEKRVNVGGGKVLDQRGELLQSMPD